MVLTAALLCYQILPPLILLYVRFPSFCLCLHTDKDGHCSADQWKHDRDLLSCSRADLITVLGVGGGGTVPLVADIKMCWSLVPKRDRKQVLDFLLSFILTRFATSKYASHLEPCKWLTLKLSLLLAVRQSTKCCNQITDQSRSLLPVCSVQSAGYSLCSSKVAFYCILWWQRVNFSIKL